MNSARANKPQPTPRRRPARHRATHQTGNPPLAREANLSLADKPASACLASRIEYGRPVTRENLSQVEQAEAALHALGFPQVRVRHHGDLARIEIAREDLPRALSLPVLKQITAAIKPLGFLYVTLDTEGYRSGSMNDTLLTASSIRPVS